MTTPPPTPEEITAARELLLRVPGVKPDSRLSAIAEIASPLVQMAVELRTRIDRWHETPDVGRLLSTLETIAASHGLRITTDPGELVGYAEVQPRPQDPGWYIAHAGSWQPDERPERNDLNPGARVVALYLPPDGSQA